MNVQAFLGLLDDERYIADGTPCAQRMTAISGAASDNGSEDEA